MEKWRKEFREHYPIENLPIGRQKEYTSLLSRFEQEHPQLMELEPEIGIACIDSDEDGNPLELYHLLVGHPFIFDYRLLPKEFENLEVKAQIMENMPEEFPEEYWMEPNLDEYYSIERFEKFVNRNFDKIKTTLKSSNLSKQEALNALTGDFVEHKEWINRIRKERELEHKEHVAFFNQILEETNVAFLKSDVYNMIGNYDWGYSITATSFQKNEKVIVGFNWGVDKDWLEKGNSYGPQKEYPYRSFISNYNELGSFKRTIPYFHQHFGFLIPKVQINYCFFRSEKESQITPGDLALCKDLFNKLIEYLEPSMLISFSKSLNQHLLSEKRIDKIEELKIYSGNKLITVTKGIIEIADNSIPYYTLPHPNYPITGEAREKAWRYCFGAHEYLEQRKVQHPRLLMK